MSVTTHIYKAGQALNSAPINVRARQLAGFIKVTFGVGAVLMTIGAIGEQVAHERAVSNTVLLTGFAASQLCFACVVAYAFVNR